MKTSYSSRPSSYRIPGYSQNAVLQLIVAAGICFISYHLTNVLMRLGDARPGLFEINFASNLGLQSLGQMSYKVWTVLTYGWIHSGFWDLFSNMIWLYCFGGIVQMLIGYKQVIPMFVYSMIAGGIFYLLGQFIPGIEARAVYLFGAHAAITGIAVAALTLAPSYRMYITPTFSIPLPVVACIFFALMVMNSNLEASRLLLLAGGAAAGFGYVRLTQNGYQPGAWMYDIFDNLERKFSPDERAIANKYNKKRSQVLNKMYEPKQGITQMRIDNILDKINQHGYDSLTKEEKEILMKASKEEL